MTAEKRESLRRFYGRMAEQGCEPLLRELAENTRDDAHEVDRVIAGGRTEAAQELARRTAERAEVVLAVLQDRKETT